MSKSKKPSAVKKFFGSIIRFFREVKVEIRKVVWPSSKTVVSNTVIVIISLVVTSVFVFSIDKILSIIVRLVLQGGLKG